MLAELMPELTETSEYEQLHPLFKDTLLDCLSQMNDELARIKATPLVKNMSETAAMSTAGSKKNPGAGTSRSSMALKKTKDVKVKNVIDPLLIKVWVRTLGILFYSSELNESVQQVS